METLASVLCPRLSVSPAALLTVTSLIVKGSSFPTEIACAGVLRTY